MWGGDQPGLPSVHTNEKKKAMSSVVEVLHLPTDRWEQKHTTGDPPLGVIGYAAAVIGNEIFFFGGYCNHRDDRNELCRHSSLYSLNVDTLNWREILPTNRTNPNHGPQMKNSCGMIAVHIGGEDYLVVVGGYPRTNEIHYFRISTGNFNYSLINCRAPVITTCKCVAG